MSDSTAHVSRRRFCAGACQAASGATLATLFSACGGSPTSPSDMTSTLGAVNGRYTTGRVDVTVSGTALEQEGGAVLVQSTAGLFLLARTGTSAYAAVEAVCTHEGCTVTDALGDVYVCPCHGSRYTRTGQVVQGPAVASLRRYTASIADGVVSIAV